MTTDVAVATPPESLRACIVVLAGRPFGVEVCHAREVVSFTSWTRVPGAPAHVLGVANLRGVILPVVDVRGLLGLPAVPAGGAVRTLVVGDGDLTVAIAIDEVLGLEVFDALTPLPDGPRHGADNFARGRLERAEGAATLLDIPALLRSPRMRPWQRERDDAKDRGGEGA